LIDSKVRLLANFQFRRCFLSMQKKCFLCAMFLALCTMPSNGARVRKKVSDFAMRQSTLGISNSSTDVEAEVHRLMHGSFGNQARTDVAAQREALEFFLKTFEPKDWSYKGMHGFVPLNCSDKVYTGPVVGIGAGLHGVTVLMHEGSDSGPKVVAKLWKGGGIGNLGHECEILDHLQQHRVPNTAICQASCNYSGHAMIVISPFREGTKYFMGSVDEEFFDSAAAARRALRDTLITGWKMLEASVANIDQGHNILYSPNGTILFIDMGIAFNLEKDQYHEYPSVLSVCINGFLDHILNKIPGAWWQDGRATLLLQEVGMPTTPEGLKASLDFAKLIDEKVLARVPNDPSEEALRDTKKQLHHADGSEK